MTDPNQSASGEMPLISHLVELRNRLLRVVAVVLVIFLCLFYFANDLYHYVSAPLRDMLPPGSSMIATEVASTFLAPFKLTLVLSILVAMPFILHQAWAFISPGLYQSEKRIALPLLVSSILLFYAGMAFAYYVVFPLLFAFFTTTGPADVAVMTDINSYLDFVLKLFFAFGVVFEIPVAIILLVSSGIVTPADLAAKRPYIIVGCFVVGMLLTPPDVMSQTLLAVPMWMLYEVGLAFGRMIKVKQKEDDEEEVVDEDSNSSPNPQ
ncbi:twin-arginine translocase subunit TatC [Pokkaliibacter sp. MBI-7]|uniref:twin-arginine translocase subunit TatC n=1 Tax=Pokkaliibacter sp. MBI-7 TaxID=3040600 RepID=UPI00244AD2F9|nr:twin-arginine translocase subunit TatC [Pokkaliibacter sp. MBI-7]MDH2433534.1 twin-arginine translocase subunit TatC [Pokkaliibacter sp. MBI-7]